MRRLFGTDGIRAPFGTPPLDQETVTALGYALAARLARRSPAPLVLVGGDTRDSTPVLAAWLAAGLAAGGARPHWLGVVTTPGVAHLVPRLRAAAGVAISASHNLHPDNGIKLVDAEGRKWSAEAEAELTELLAPQAPTAAAHPRALAADPVPVAAYLAALAGSVENGGSLAGLRLLLDAANGAAAPFAGGLFRGLGAEVVEIHAAPDGRNINRGCGSTHPQEMATATVAAGADLGLAFDGDADRVVLADEHGQVHDGDAILYLWAGALRVAGRLDPPAVVATSMSNLGLERALAAHGIGVVRCDVGDRAVVATMRQRGILLGGEQSGHVVHLGLSTTGDGLLTAVQVCALRTRAGAPLSELLRPFVRYPQLLRNVPVRRKEDFSHLPRVAAAVRSAEERLGGDGRLVLRYSGTEPLARIMLEGREQELIERLAGELEAAIAAEVGHP
jgi:phosphoglucosamine mutase